MNVYDGTVALDSHGEAWVALPAWFEALKRDFGYQLTAIGSPAPLLHVDLEVADDRFKIAGGTPGGRVSWQVIGIRQDRWANAHSVQVEEDKPDDERGYYLHPELFGKSDAARLAWLRAQKSGVEARPSEAGKAMGEVAL